MSKTLITIAAAAVLMPGGAYAKPLSAFSCNDILQESRTDSSFDLSALGTSIVDRVVITSSRISTKQIWQSLGAYATYAVTSMRNAASTKIHP